MEKLFPCSKDDVVAIARSRVNRDNKSTTNKWMMGAMIAVVGGMIIAMKVQMYVGYAMLALGVLAIYWRTNRVSKQQKEQESQLVKEWMRK